MTGSELMHRLYAARRAGVKLELGRMRALLAAVGNPQQSLDCALIGGTNGKGSTAAFVAAMARAGGQRVGRFSSPHLSRLVERFEVDGAPIGDSELLAIGTEVERAAERLGGEATFFERVTGIALVAFARAGVELAVLEVGLGGRFDATNAVAPVLSAVTGVALDHQDYLGDSLAEIAREKAGIFRPGRPAVIGCSGEPDGVPLLIGAARRVGASPIRTVAPADADALSGVELGLPGRHQRRNAACALAVAELLGIGAEARLRGLAEARLAGRLERVGDAPAIVVDGAHNPHAAAAIADELAGHPGQRQIVIGVSRGKDARGIARALAPLASRWIATQAGGERSLPADELAEPLGELDIEAPIEVVAGVADALARARELAGPDDLVLICGSLFVVGEARQALGLATADELALRDPL